MRKGLFALATLPLFLTACAGMYSENITEHLEKRPGFWEFDWFSGKRDVAHGIAYHLPEHLIEVEATYVMTDCDSPTILLDEITVKRIARADTTANGTYVIDQAGLENWFTQINDAQIGRGENGLLANINYEADNKAGETIFDLLRRYGVNPTIPNFGASINSDLEPSEQDAPAETSELPPVFSKPLSVECSAASLLGLSTAQQLGKQMRQAILPAIAGTGVPDNAETDDTAASADGPDDAEADDTAATTSAEDSKPTEAQPQQTQQTQQTQPAFSLEAMVSQLALTEQVKALEDKSKGAVSATVKFLCRPTKTTCKILEINNAPLANIAAVSAQNLIFVDVVQDNSQQDTNPKKSALQKALSQPKGIFYRIAQDAKFKITAIRKMENGTTPVPVSFTQNLPIWQLGQLAAFDVEVGLFEKSSTAATFQNGSLTQFKFVSKQIRAQALIKELETDAPEDQNDPDT